MTEPRTELDAARMMIAGELPSPTKYGSMTLWAMRVSGTGLAYRSQLEEHVWRDPSIYLNDEFLARIGGLPVVWEHPERTDLTSAEFADRVIGSVMLPYIKGEDVWAICRIFDKSAIEAMEAGQLSTSPGVHFMPTDGNEKVDLGNGKTLLIEGNPFYVEHLAVCAQGVWDKSRPPTGVQTDELITEPLSATERADSMAEEEGSAEARKKAEEEKKARDDRRDTAIDKMLSHLDSFGARIDAMEMADKARRDSEEKERKEREDSARRDAQARRDAERDEWMKEDAEACKAEDAVEEKEKEELRGKGETEETAADKARKDRKSRRDKARKDAEEKEEEERKKKDSARHDSDTEAALLRRIAALEAIARPVSDEDRTMLADIQARADSAYMALGDRAPEPMRGETTHAYRIRVLRPIQKYSKSWKDKNLSVLPSDALDVIEPQIYADADVAARTPDNVPVGQLVERYKTDPQTGLRTITFVGKGTFIGQMSQRGRYAILNRSNQGRA